MADPFAQLLEWKAKRPRRDVALVSEGQHHWLCRLYDADRLVALGHGRTHAAAILNALSDYGEPGADAGGAR